MLFFNYIYRIIKWHVLVFDLELGPLLNCFITGLPTVVGLTFTPIWSIKKSLGIDIKQKILWTEVFLSTVSSYYIKGL